MRTAPNHLIPMPMTVDPALTLAQWMSPAFPVGAFAFSHGLESAIDAGDVTDVDGLHHWLQALLVDGSGANDAIFLCHAYHASDADTLRDLTDLCCAFGASAGRVLETCEQGASFARTLRALSGIDLPDLPYPIAVGRAAALHGLPLDMTLRFFLQGFAANLVSAAIRRVPLGQTDGQKVLRDMLVLLETVAAQAPSQSLDELSAICFAADIAAMQHETLYSKTFRT